jgi:hypothetical protein
VSLVAPVVIGGLVTLPYWLGPALVHRSARMPLVMAMEHIGPDELAALDAHTFETLETAVSTLTAMAFDRPTAFRARDGATTAVGALLEHPVHGDLASFAIMRAPNVAPQAVPLFESEWDDGFRVLTTNSSQASVFPRSPAVDAMTLPTVRELDALYRIHRARVARAKTSAERLHLSRGEDALTIERNRQARDRHQHLASGYLLREGDVVRPTVRGACLMTWRSLPPWKNLQFRERDRREAALLQELGATA